MLCARFLLAGLVLAQAMQVAGAASDQRRCLSQEHRRAAIASHKAMTVGRAIALAKKRYAGDVVRAKLCEGEHGSLRYVLTVLARDGKVTRLLVDATSGKLLNAR